jgi:hypothetical protein
MRTNSGSGKSSNNLRDPTMKEHELARKKAGNAPAHGRAETAADADPSRRERAEVGPAD